MDSRVSGSVETQVCQWSTAGRRQQGNTGARWSPGWLCAAGLHFISGVPFRWAGGCGQLVAGTG